MPTSPARARAGAWVRRLRTATGRVPTTAWWVGLPVLVYLVLVLGGVTQSSIGISTLRVDPDAATPGMIGGGVGIRSDEYLTSSPLLLGVIETGRADDGNPLTAPEGFFTQLPSGPVSSIVLFDGSFLRLGPVLPDALPFAAHWWLPFLLLALGAPAYFRTLTGSRWWGLFAAAMVVLTPATAWWSFSPLGVISFTLAGAAALQRVPERLAERRWVSAAAWCLTSAVLLARTPLHYQPWAIVLALPILAAAVVPMLVPAVGRARSVVSVVATGGLSLALAGGVVLESIAGIRASTGTSYPGHRVSTGGANPLPELFGASSLANLKHLDVVGTNPSEVSSAFTVAAVLAVVLLLVGVRLRDRTHRLATATLLVGTGFWFVWSTVDVGAWASHVPVLNLVPPNRSGDVLGYLAVLLLCLVLPAAAPLPWRRAVLVGASLALLAAYAGSLLRAETIPGLPLANVWCGALGVGVVTTLLCLRPRWWPTYVLSAVLGALLMWNVNPVQVGLADLRGTPAADRLVQDGADARREGAVWASDDTSVDALLLATGVPALSGRQLSGPDVAAWTRLDPGDAHREVWNRGGSFITFRWTAADTLSFANPTGDAIEVSGSPCALAAREPALTHVVSSSPLEGSCLTPDGELTWGGEQRLVYVVGH